MWGATGTGSSETSDVRAVGEPVTPLRIGVVGCGPIAQHAHFDSIRRARNAELYAICDVSQSLVSRMSEVHRPTRCYLDFDRMLEDPLVEAVVIATADAFHVPLAARAIEAGKHVLVEKPLGMTTQECEELATAVIRSGLVLQVGFMKRFDPGIVSAKQYIDADLGEILALKAWYCDSYLRYEMTDGLLPIPVTADDVRRPAESPKANKQRYYMLAHGSHLVDLARFLAGPIVELEARFRERGGASCWLVSLAFESGAIGQLDLTIPVRMDWHEGFDLYAEGGTVRGASFLPWYQRATEVDCYSARSRISTRPFHPSAHFYKAQVEGFVDYVRTGEAGYGATIEDGLASMRTMVAVSQSVRTGRSVRIDEAKGGLV